MYEGRYVFTIYFKSSYIYIYSWIKWHKHEIYEYIRGLHATEISGGDHITQNEWIIYDRLWRKWGWLFFFFFLALLCRAYYVFQGLCVLKLGQWSVKFQHLLLPVLNYLHKNSNLFSSNLFKVWSKLWLIF